MNVAAEGVNIPESEAVPVEDVNEAVETSSPEASEQEEAKEETKKPERPSWEVKRIGELARQKNEAKAEVQRLAQEKEQLAQQLAEYQRVMSGDESQPQKESIDPEHIYKLAEQIAEERQRTAKFEERKDSIVSAGQQKYGDKFDEATNTLFYAGVIGTEDGRLTPFGQLLMDESKACEELIMKLAEDPYEAQRIASLPPLKQARAIWELESRLSTQKPQEPVKASNAPAPVKPVGSRTANVVSPEDMTMEEYVKFRNEQERKR